MRFQASTLYLVASLALAPGCIDSPASPRDDARPDQRTVGDGVRPPDLGTRDAMRPGNVGAPCQPGIGKGCTGDTVCLQVATGVGLCAIPNCTLEDITTSAIEDNCPPTPGTSRRSVCTTVEVPRGDAGYKAANYCLPECTPAPDKNSCAVINPKLTCDPISLLLNGHAEVCVMPACSDDWQCGKDPVKPGATCDRATGTCQIVGDPKAHIGSPCLVSADCGPGQFCLPEYVDSSTGKVVLSDGYCTIVGCRYYDSQSKSQLWSCPQGSKCFVLGANQALSLCLAVGCTVGANPAKDACRDEAPPGQYTCTLQGGVGVCWADVTQQK